MVEQLLTSVINDVNTLKADALVVRKDVQDHEERSAAVVEHCDSLMNVSSAALAVVHAVRWKRKIGAKKAASPSSPQ